jgi:hypothetical protein
VHSKFFCSGLYLFCLALRLSRMNSIHDRSWKYCHIMDPCSEITFEIRVRVHCLATPNWSTISEPARALLTQTRDWGLNADEIYAQVDSQLLFGIRANFLCIWRFGCGVNFEDIKNVAVPNTLANTVDWTWNQITIQLQQLYKLYKFCFATYYSSLVVKRFAYSSKVTCSITARVVFLSFFFKYFNNE